MIIDVIAGAALVGGALLMALGALGLLRFPDVFTLLKVDGQWKIMNKVFHLHAA